ncbi:hypothetical protein RDI58_000367 [Solanum bulbocastanum]|uniref:Uncharacterized protein n=1 Tax=Solanum bulbocastanum TaxID=147425 RepID=A0AAN8UC41_SOLBU
MDQSYSPSRRRTRSSRIMTQNQQQLKNDEDVSLCKSTTTTNLLKNNDTTSINNITSEYYCSTPKSKRYQIPKIKSCPPAPKKKRRIVFSSSTSSCNDINSLKRSPISFFTTTTLDLELFFNFAH